MYEKTNIQIYIPKTDVSQTQLDYSYKAVFQLYILFHTSLKKKKKKHGGKY